MYRGRSLMTSSPGDGPWLSDSLWKIALYKNFLWMLGNLNPHFNGRHLRTTPSGGSKGNQFYRHCGLTNHKKKVAHKSHML